MGIKKQRDNAIDIIKGISIISIVFGHAGFGILFFSYFQVIAFYYVGGLTFKEKTIKDFSKNIFLRHYITFVIASIIGILLWYIISKFTLYKFCNRTPVNVIMHILCFDLCFNLMAPAWFLFPFCIITIMFYALKKLIKNDIVILCITLILFLFTCKYRNYSFMRFFWNKCFVIVNVGIGLFLYNAGYLVNKYKENINKRYSFLSGDLFFISILVLFIYQTYLKFSFNMREGKIGDGLGAVILIFFSIYFIVYLSKIMCNNNNFGFITKMISFIGKHTMSIMLFHIPAFSLATILFHNFWGLKLPTNWTNSYTNIPYNIITAIIGILLPIFIVEFWQIVKRLLINIRFEKICKN